MMFQAPMGAIENHPGGADKRGEKEEAFASSNCEETQTRIQEMEFCPLAR